MIRQEIIQALRDFASGRRSIGDLDSDLYLWLSELRQKPTLGDLPDEQEFLSTLELYVHEAQEGYRSLDEVYSLIKSISDPSLTSVTTIPVSSSSTSDFLIFADATPVENYPLEPALT